MNTEILSLIEKVEPYKNNIYTLSEIIEKTGEEIINYRSKLVKKYCIIDNILNPYLEINLYKELVQAAHYLDYNKIYKNILAKPLGEKGTELQKSFFSIGSIRRKKTPKTIDDLKTEIEKIEKNENISDDVTDLFSYFLYTAAVNKNDNELKKFLGLFNLDQNVRTSLFFTARTADWNIITRDTDRYMFPEGITERYMKKKLNEQKLYIYLN